MQIVKILSAASYFHTLDHAIENYIGFRFWQDKKDWIITSIHTVCFVPTIGTHGSVIVVYNCEEH